LLCTGYLLMYLYCRGRKIGRENTSSFCKESFGPEKQWPKLPTRQGNHGRTIHPPHSSMDGCHSERPPRRDAIYFISVLGGLLSRECLILSCLPKPSFADMSCRVGNMSATCLWSCCRHKKMLCWPGGRNVTTFMSATCLQMSAITWLPFELKQKNVSSLAKVHVCLGW